MYPFFFGYFPEPYFSCLLTRIINRIIYCESILSQKCNSVIVLIIAFAGFEPILPYILTVGHNLGKSGKKNTFA